MSARSTFRADRALLAGALALCAPAAARACDAMFVPTSSELRIDYDPFAFAGAAGRLTFDVEGRGTEACEADLVLLDATRVAIMRRDVGGTGVIVTFSPRSGDAALAATATPGIWRIRIEPGRRARLTVDGIVTQDAIAAAGEHADDLTLELRDVDAMTTQAAPLPFRTILAAVPRAQMNVAGTAGTFGQGSSVARVDFGILASDATRRVFLQVRANSSARLTIDSVNHGRLLRADSPAAETGIAYTARLIDEPVDLSSHWERVIEPPRSVAGTSLPLDLSIGTVGGHVAGTYSDVLTIELSAI